MAGKLAAEFIETVLARIDIVELIGARVALKKAGRDFQACCPFHNEKTPSFTVSPTKQFYHCFGCSAHGNAIGFLMAYERVPFIEAVEELARQVGLDMPHRDAAAEAPGALLYPLLQQGAEYFQQQLREHPEGKEARAYLARRGLTQDVLTAYRVGYAPSAWDSLARELGPRQHASAVQSGLLVRRAQGGVYDRFRARVMFPVQDRRGRVIGFGGRVLDDSSPKYLNSPETPLFHKGRELYGLYQARLKRGSASALIVVEGYMDVLALAQHGFDNAVATLGTATTSDHAERLLRELPEVIFCFDGDRAGRAAAWRALEAVLPYLQEGHQVRFLFLPENEDPDSWLRVHGGAGFQTMLAAAVPLSDYFFGELEHQVDMDSLDGRARLVALARPKLQRMPAGVFHDMMWARLAECARIDTVKLVVPKPAEPLKRSTMKGNTRGTPHQKSLVRYAITLLLHRPNLAQQTGSTERLIHLDEAGVPLLIALLELIRAKPHLNTATVLEYWRDTEEERHLAKLAQWQPEAAVPDLEREFRDTMGRLLVKARKAGVARLTQTTTELNARDKQRLQDLLREHRTDYAGPSQEDIKTIK